MPGNRISPQSGEWFKWVGRPILAASRLAAGWTRWKARPQAGLPAPQSRMERRKQAIPEILPRADLVHGNVHKLLCGASWNMTVARCCIFAALELRDRPGGLSYLARKSRIS